MSARVRAGGVRPRTRVMIVEDDPAALFGIQTVVASQSDFEVVATAADGNEVVDGVLRHRPDVVLMDIQLGKVDGIEALRELRRLPEPPPVIMLTAFDVNDYIVDAIDAGALGYVLKVRLPEELAPAIRAVRDGDAFLSPSSTRRLLGQVSDSARSAARAEAARKLTALSEKERAVLRLVALGETNARVGQELFISEGTVKSHLSAISAKLGCNRAQAIVLAERGGLLT